MFSLSKGKITKNKSIVLDIQSGVVRGAFVKFHHGEPAQISSVITKSIPNVPQNDDGSRMIKEILKITEEVLRGIVKDHGYDRIDTIHYILSSPWIFSESTSVKVDYEKETRITSKIVDEVLHDQMKKRTLSEDTQHIEMKVCEVRLNGYAIEEFDGKNAKHLEIFFYNSYGSKAFFEKLTALVHKVVRIKRHEYHSALLLQYSALKLINHAENDYIYIHVHSELTDVVVVKNGLCKHTASFPLGTITLLRKISEATNQSIETVDSLLSLYQTNRLEDSEKERIKKVVDPLLTNWSQSCIKNLSDVFGVMYIPRKLYLSVHSHFDVYKYALLFNNELNFEIDSYDKIQTKGLVEFENNSPQSVLMKLYTLVLSNMI